MDIHGSIHRGWVKTTGNVTWLWMLRGTCSFGWGNDIAAHRHHWIVNLETDVTTHGTGSWLTRPNMGGVMGKYPFMSGRGMSRYLPLWCRILPPIWRGMLATCRGVASYPHSTRINDNHKNRSWQIPNSNHPTAWAWGCTHWKKKGGECWITPKLWTVIQYCCYLFIVKNCNRQYC